MEIFLLTDRMDVGGAETHVFELSRILRKRGHRVTVFSSGGRLSDELVSVGVEHVWLPAPISPADTAWALDILAKAIRRHKPHVVHAHTRRWAFLCHALSASLPFAFVFTAHAMFHTRFPARPLSYFPPSTIAVSRDIRDLLVRDFSVPRHTITVVENGIDTRRFSPRPAKEHPFTVMTVSRADRDCAEASRLLISIAPLLTQRLGRAVRVVIVGGGNAFHDLCRAAEAVNKRMARKAVFLLGNRTDVDKLLHQCDVFVGVSRAALEAMSSAKPVILCGNEGYLGILDQSTLDAARATNFCARGHAKPSASLLLQDLLFLASLPHYKRVAMGIDGRVTVRRHYSVEQMAHKTESIYRAEFSRFQKTRRADLLVGGYYGCGNCGDELVLQSILDQQKRLSPNLRLSVLSASKHPSVTTIPRDRPLAVINAIKNSGAFILGGGSLLQDSTSRRSLYYYLALLRLAHGMGIPTMLYANGLGPLSPAALEKCRAVLSSVDVISLRDQQSYRTVRAMKLPHTRVVLGADPALLLPPVSVSPPQTPLLALFPKGGRPRQEQEQLARAAISVAKRYGMDVAVIPMDNRADRAEAQRMVTEIGRLCPSLRAFFVPVTPKTAEKQIAAASLVIGQRLHALILAFHAGIPAVGILCDPKISAFLEEIDRKAAGVDPVHVKHRLLPACEYALSRLPSPSVVDRLTARAKQDAILANQLILRT